MTDQPTLQELQDRARELNVSGRSSMNRDELAAAIAEAEAGHDAGGTNPGGTPPTTDAQASTAGLAAAAELAPATPDEVGRPDLLDLARSRATDRNPRVIGADN